MFYTPLSWFRVKVALITSNIIIPYFVRIYYSLVVSSFKTYVDGIQEIARKDGIGANILKKVASNRRNYKRWIKAVSRTVRHKEWRKNKKTRRMEYSLEIV